MNFSRQTGRITRNYIITCWNYEMKSKYIATIMLLLISTAPIAYAGTTGIEDNTNQTAHILQSLRKKASSEDPQVRIRLIDELVTTECDDDLIDRSLRYNLSSEVYSEILNTSLDGLYRHLDDHDKTDDHDKLGDYDKYAVLSRIHFIAREHPLPGVDSYVQEFMGDRSPSIRKKALSVLVDLKSRLATPYLVPLLGSKVDLVHWRTIHNLHTIGAVDAIPEILKLLSELDSNSQHWAVWYLYEFNAKDSANQVYEHCIEGKAIDKMSPFILTVLIKWGDERAIPLAMQLLTSTDRGNRWDMSDRLVELDAKSIELPLITFLMDPTPVTSDIGTESNIRANAIRLLGRLHSKKAIPALRVLVKNGGKGNSVAQVAAQQLGTLQAKDAVPELLAMLDRSRDGGWYRATEALAKIGDVATFRRILDELKSVSPSSHHVEVLLTMAGGSDPTTYHKLKDLELTRIEVLPLDEYLQQVAELTGIQVEISDDVPLVLREAILGGTGVYTGLSALWTGIRRLNYDQHSYTVFIEEGVARVVTIPEAYRLWERWLDTHISGPRPEEDKEFQQAGPGYPPQSVGSPDP